MIDLDTGLTVEHCVRFDEDLGEVEYLKKNERGDFFVEENAGELAVAKEIRNGRFRFEYAKPKDAMP